jgi:hypothetical protein
MADLLRDLVAGVPSEHLCARAAFILRQSTDARRANRARMTRSHQTHMITARRSAFLRIRVVRYPHLSGLRGACVDLIESRSKRECKPIHSSLRIDECLERVAFVSHGVMGWYETGGPMAVAASFTAAIGDRWQSSVTRLKARSPRQ